MTSSMPSPLDALAERQVAQALTAAGFSRVRSIAAQATRRTADLIGELAGRRYALEVRRASRPLRPDASFEPLASHAPLPYPTLESYFTFVWREKRGQLEATLQAERCDAAGLIVVVQGQRGPSWDHALARAWQTAAIPHNMHFVLADAQGRLSWRPVLTGSWPPR